MTAPRPEPWLRGPVSGIPALLQPAAHALIMALEDVEHAVSELSDEQLWLTPSGISPIGFQVAHLAGSTDRLLTYARGEPLTERQRARLAEERQLQELRPSLPVLLEAWRGAVEAALRQLAGTPESGLLGPVAIGRAGLPSTVIGVLFHAAEHAARHTGQVVTTAKLIRGGASAG